MSKIVNSIICDDVLAGLKKIPDSIVSLLVTSPPYNVDISYDSHKDDMPYREYLQWLKKVFDEGKRVLRNGGRMCINIDAMTNRQEDKPDEYVRPIYVDLGNVMRDIGMKFYGEHVWYKSDKCPCKGGGQWNGKKTAWGSYMSCSTPSVRRNHEYILVYSKGTFTLEKTAESGDSDISGKEFQDWISSVWSINAETRNMGNHPVPFPVELPSRCIKLYCYPNDVVLDPFNGVGTTTYAAKILNRRYIGIDMSPSYCKFAEDRLGSYNDIFSE